MAGSVFLSAGLEARYNVKVPMRDGVKLSADIYSPSGEQGPFPVILGRTPYNNMTEESIEQYARRAPSIRRVTATRFRFRLRSSRTSFASRSAASSLRPEAQSLRRKNGRAVRAARSGSSTDGCRLRRQSVVRSR